MFLAEKLFLFRGFHYIMFFVFFFVYLTADDSTSSGTNIIAIVSPIAILVFAVLVLAIVIIVYARKVRKHNSEITA